MRRSPIVPPPAPAIATARAIFRCVRTLFVLQDLALSIPIVPIPGILIATIMSARQLNPVLPMPVARLHFLVARTVFVWRQDYVPSTPIVRAHFLTAVKVFAQRQHLALLKPIASRATNPSAYQVSAMRHIQQV